MQNMTNKTMYWKWNAAELMQFYLNILIKCTILKRNKPKFSTNNNSLLYVKEEMVLWNAIYIPNFKFFANLKEQIVVQFINYYYEKLYKIMEWFVFFCTAILKNGIRFFVSVFFGTAKLLLYLLFCIVTTS